MYKKIWEASEEEKKNSVMQHYMTYLYDTQGLHFADYNSLHRWSVENNEQFWESLFLFFDPIITGSLKPTHENVVPDFLHYDWFPNVHLSFAENLLRKSNDQNFKDKVALNFQHEIGLSKKITYGELKDQVQQLQKFLSPIIKEGDVVAAYMPNAPETVIGMLAANSLGAIFTSTSCDFGVQGVLDRFGQTEPKVLITTSRYTYNGKEFDLRDRILELQEKLPSIECIIIVDILSDKAPLILDGCTAWTEITKQKTKASDELTFKRLPFNAPLYIMYSSGTTGKPKSIVHSAGGTLINHIKELGLHNNVSSDTAITYFTTCGWMMWNWLISSLFFGAEIMLYEGSPAYPSIGNYMELINREKINILGISPRFVKTLEDNLTTLPTSYPYLKSILSTGAPLMPEQFDFIYQHIKKDVHLVSLSGGTDIIGCFMLGNPLLPVHQGEIQCLGLGLDVAAFDDSGNPLIEEEGELVCRNLFPNAPVYFWKDKDGSLIRNAYFSRYENTWHHGDFIRISKIGCIRIFGRSDATLNPGGVRIGTAEIYRQTEKLSFLDDTLCVSRQNSDDVSVILFVKMSEGSKLTEENIQHIKDHIRKNASPRHVPSKILEVQAIPYTRNGKKMEILVSRILNHRPVQNIEVLSNPKCLEEYQSYAEQI
ncbi:MAG: acetoacetyl-CoA synthetase [Chlamydiales bacterium]|jgi:acetoacetyl-CoA synthetase